MLAPRSGSSSSEEEDAAEEDDDVEVEDDAVEVDVEAEELPSGCVLPEGAAALLAELASLPEELSPLPEETASLPETVSPLPEVVLSVSPAASGPTEEEPAGGSSTGGSAGGVSCTAASTGSAGGASGGTSSLASTPTCMTLAITSADRRTAIHFVNVFCCFTVYLLGNWLFGACAAGMAPSALPRRGKYRRHFHFMLRKIFAAHISCMFHTSKFALPIIVASGHKTVTLHPPNRLPSRIFTYSVTVLTNYVIQRNIFAGFAPNAPVAPLTVRFSQATGFAFSSKTFSDVRAKSTKGIHKKISSKGYGINNVLML